MAESARHLGLILNGKSAGDEAVRAAVAALRADGARVDVRVTWEDGDAERYTAEAVAAGVDTVIAAGGDGTLGHVAGALAACDAPADALPALALLPLGTANDFALAAGIATAPEEAFALLRHAPVPVDLLRVEGDGVRRWCINLASGGFGTAVTQDADDGLKKMLGGWAYVLSGVARLGSIEPFGVRIEGEDFAWEGDAIALAIGNASHAGGGQPLCPDARIDDGRLDLTIVPELQGEVAKTIGTWIAEGKAAALDQASVRARLRGLRIAAAAPLTLNLDGEPIEAREFLIACAPGRLRMHLPAACPLLSAFAAGEGR